MMSILKYTIAFIILTIPISSMASSRITHPGNGSPERKALLDVLRPHVEKEWRRKIVFRVDEINVSSTLAFIQATPVDSLGREYKCEAVFNADECDFVDGMSVIATFRKKSGKWIVSQQGTGGTDVWWCGGGLTGYPKIPRELSSACGF